MAPTTRGTPVAAFDIRQVSEEYFPRIHRAALVLTGNPWDADDLAQETFLEVARQVGRFQGKSSLFTWMYGILLNLERRHRRKLGMWRRKLRVLWGGEPERSGPPADSPLEVREWKTGLWEKVSRLPDGQRHALVLRFSEHLSYEQIADVLECPLGTVKSRIHNGLATLREHLDGAGGSCRDVPAHVWEDQAHAV